MTGIITLHELGQRFEFKSFLDSNKSTRYLIGSATVYLRRFLVSWIVDDAIKKIITHLQYICGLNAYFDAKSGHKTMNFGFYQIYGIIKTFRALF